MKRSVPLILFVAAWLWCVQAVAQNEYEVSFGSYTVNYNAFPSTFLEPAIARAAGLKYAENQGVISIAIRQHISEGQERAVKASVSGTTTNLIGQQRRVNFIEVRDGNAIYYIGNFTVSRNESINFNIALTPEGETQRHQFKFTRQF